MITLSLLMQKAGVVCKSLKYWLNREMSEGNKDAEFDIVHEDVVSFFLHQDLELQSLKTFM